MAISAAFAVVSAMVGIVQLAKKNFGTAPQTGSTITFAVGLDGAPNGARGAGGDLPEVRIWDQNAKALATKTRTGTIEDGSLQSIVVEHDHQGVYTLFSARKDSICVAWVTTSWSESSGGNQYAVSGDFGARCGATWHYSGMYPSNDNSYQPKCFWIDEKGGVDENNNTRYTGFQVHWPSYSAENIENPTASPDEFCNGIDFGLRDQSKPKILDFNPEDRLKGRRGPLMQPPTAPEESAPPPEAPSDTPTEDPAPAADPSEAPAQPSDAPADAPSPDAEAPSPPSEAASDLPGRPVWTSSRLIISNLPAHSAKDLCTSPTSMGPDLVSVYENVFCDMETKTLYNICRDGVAQPCFDMDSQSVIGISSGGTQKRSIGGQYTRVHDWRSG